MDATLIARGLIVRLASTHGEDSRIGMTLLGWVRDMQSQLWPRHKTKKTRRVGDDRKLDWAQMVKKAGHIVLADSRVVAPVGCIADVLGLDSDDRDLLIAVALLCREGTLNMLRHRLVAAGADMREVVMAAIDRNVADPATAFGKHPAVRLGLVHPRLLNAGGIDIELDWLLSQLIGDALTDPDAVVNRLAGAVQSTRLTTDDFADHAHAIQFLTRLLTGALAEQATGVNILIHGPPGTGKTELARVLAGLVPAALHAVGEADDYGDEPTRADRLSALRRAQHVLARRGSALLLFDEMEDLIGEGSGARGATGTFAGGSKLFVNRLLETNPVPIIWTSNAIGEVDRAHLRRMSFVLRMDHPRPEARAQIVSRLAAQEQVVLATSDAQRIAALSDDAASVGRLALRAQRLACGSADEAATTAESILRGLRGGDALPPKTGFGHLDLELIVTHTPVSALVSQIVAAEADDVSLLLSGPPGTGKTALAHHLADALRRPLIIKRASDLLSKWVGETEQNIAGSFSEARDKGAVLLFDEVDSILMSRADAQRSWEVTQVNELLTWMEAHPLPFIAATNFESRLDPAAMRRFVFKLRLEVFDDETAAKAFARFFGRAAPADLKRVTGLTPGDFAVVRRQLRFGGDETDAAIIAALSREVTARPGMRGTMGF
jgi:transitional endoplasmic reticulum ATPase